MPRNPLLVSAAALVGAMALSGCETVSETLGLEDEAGMMEEEAGMAMDDPLAMAPPGGDYQMVSNLVALPEYLPGLGTLYVDPETLPAGPFLAYDRDGELVSTVYMVPLDAMQNQQEFEDLAVGPGDVDHVEMYYNGGHPGVPQPHYHIVLWRIPPDEAAEL